MLSSNILSKISLAGTVFRKSILHTYNMTSLQCQQNRAKSDLYEPDYMIANINIEPRANIVALHNSGLNISQICNETGLSSMEPDEPVYDCLNLQIKGYDYALLESYQSQLHRFAEVMGLQVDECWATPAQQLKVQRFKPKSTVVDAEYQLNIYERNVQISDAPAYLLGTLLRVARATLPEGCSLTTLEHTPAHEEIRYVPDNQLIELQQQLQDMGGSRPEKKKRK